MVKLSLDSGKIRENIGMVKFQVVQYYRTWMVMHKLGALIKEGSVVFVRLNYKKWRFASWFLLRGARRTRGDIKVLRYPAN